MALTVRNRLFRREAAPLFPPSFGARSLLALAAVLLLYLTNPTALTGLPGRWAPSAGLGLVLIAWLGPRAAWLLIAAGLIAAALQVFLVSGYFAGRADSTAVSITVGNTLLEIAECISAAWWVYRRRGGGGREPLNDPQSAVLFVLVVPGLTAVLFAAARALLQAAVFGAWADFSQRLVQLWLSQALGFLAVAPPLLTAATPWLVRRGLVPPETPAQKQSADGGHAGADPLTRGDAVEIAGLALGAGLLALLLAWSYGRQGLEGWQPLRRCRCCWSSGPAYAKAMQPRRRFDGGCCRRFSPVDRGVFYGRRRLDGKHCSYPRQSVGLLCGARPVGRCCGRLGPRQRDALPPDGDARAGRGLQRPIGARPARGRLDAEVTLVSRGASGTLFGCPPERIAWRITNGGSSVSTPEDREVVLAAVAQLSRQKQPVTCEYRLAPLALPDSSPPHAGEGGVGGRSLQNHRPPPQLSPPHGGRE